MGRDPLYDGPVNLGDVDDDGWPVPVYKGGGKNPHCTWSRSVCEAMRSRRPGASCTCRYPQQYPDDGVQRAQHSLVQLAWLALSDVSALSPPRQAVLDRAVDDLRWLMRDLEVEEPAVEVPPRRPPKVKAVRGYEVVDAPCEDCELPARCQIWIRDPVKPGPWTAPHDGAVAPMMQITYCRRRPYAETAGG